MSMKSFSIFFDPAELVCKCGTCEYSERSYHHDQSFLNLLDAVRAIYGSPVRVTSGMRCSNHNRNVGGVTGSRHVLGRAADLVADDMERLSSAIDRVAGQVCKRLPIYKERHDNYIHVHIV